MALNWRPRGSNLYLPQVGALKDSINKSYTTMFGVNTGIVGAPQFEAPQSTLYVQGGRAGMQGGDMIAEALQTPARAIEAPLRPFDVLTDGGVGKVFDTLWGVGKQIPVIGTALSAIEGSVKVFEASNLAMRAASNASNASMLAATADSDENERVYFDGRFTTVKEMRQKLAERWGVNEWDGTPMSLEMLIERAKQDPWSFGQFKIDDNGIVGFIKEAYADPINIATLGLAKGVGLGLQAARAAGWTRPTVSLGGRAPWLPRVGAGALTRLRGDLGSSVARGADYLERMGHLGVGPATLGDVVRLAQKIYFPAYGKLSAPTAMQLSSRGTVGLGVRTGLGINRPTSALAAWQLGGAAQMGVSSAIEGGLGFLTGRQYDAQTGIMPAEQAGWLDDIQDIFHAINNSHPLSDSQAFTVLALFSPWQKSINVAFRRRGVNPAAYYNDGIKYTSRQFEDLTGHKFASEADFLTQLGDGDAALGQRIFEYLADEVDMNLVRNQFSDFFNETLSTIESKVQRAQFLTREITETVLSRRATGALQGRSLADNILRFYREGMSSNPETRLRRGNRTISWEGFRDHAIARYNASEHAANLGFQHMGDLIVADGAPITREILGGILRRLEALDPNAMIPRDLARDIIEGHPSLIYANEFWQEFSMTLGQLLDNTAKFDAPLLPTEGITIANLRAKVEELLDSAPSERELYHERLFVEERAKIEAGEAPSVIRSPIPEDTPSAMASIRKRFVTMGNHALDLHDKIINIRNTEFYRNGRGKWEAAKELIGHFGNTFRRADANTFVKTPPKFELVRVKSQRQPVIRIGDGAPPPTQPSGVTLSFTDRDYNHRTHLVKEAYETTIGDKHVYIFKPDATEHYRVNRALPFDDDIYKISDGWDQEKRQGIYRIRELDMWYVASPDGNGTLLTNNAFATPQLAAEWVHTISDSHVSVRINDGVIRISGKTWYPEIKTQELGAGGRPQPRTPQEYEQWALSDPYASMEMEILEDVRTGWTNRGVKKKPRTIWYEDSGYTLPGHSRPDRTYYFIGDDGLPHGSVRLDMGEGNDVASINTYFDPDYRGPKEYGNPAEMTYDRIFRDGFDLSQVSGTSTTVKGSRFTARYWANRRDAYDTEALALAIENGGRIMEVPVLAPTTTKILPDVPWTDRSDIPQSVIKASKMPDDMREAYYFRSHAGVDVIGWWGEDANGRTTIKVTEISPDGTINRYDSTYVGDIAEAHAKEEPIAGLGEAQLETLARWGFEEVARYGDAAPVKIIKDSYSERYQYESHRDYVHHVRPASSLEEVMENGIPTGLSRNYELAGVYFAEEISQALGLAPPGMANEGMLLRVKKSDLPDLQVSRFDGERVNPRVVSPDIVEYLGNDNKWHPIKNVQRAVFAYRGGNPKTAILNSRVKAATLKYKPSNKVFSGRRARGKSQYKPAYSKWDRNSSTEYMFDAEQASEIWSVESAAGESYIFKRESPVLYERPYEVHTPELEAIAHSDPTYDYPAYATFEEALEYFTAGTPGEMSFEGARKAALNLARKRANDASLITPSLESLGPGYTNSRKFFSPAERRKHLNELAAEMERRAALHAESIAKIDDTVKLVSGLNEVTDINRWFDRASPSEIETLTQQVKELNAEWPSLQVTDGGIFIDPRQERLGHLLAGYSTLARHVFDYGFLSPISRFYDSMFTPKHARAIQREVLQELEAQTALVGMSHEQTKRFLEGVRQRVGETRSARGLGNLVGTHTARNIRALDESTLRVLITQAAGEATLDTVLARFGTVQKMISEAANGLLQRSARRARHGGRVSKIEAAADAAFRHYQYDPVLEHVSDATHRMSKFWYPLLRFTADPMFMLMNAVEPYVYGISRHGWNKMRHQRTQFQQELNKRAIDRASRHSIPAGGFAVTEELPIETLMTDAGVFTIPRNMRSSIEAEHQIGRMDSYRNALRAIPENDPLAQLFQEKFGTANPDQWADEMDNIMFSWMNDGPETTVKEAWMQMAEYYNFDSEDLQIMAPFVNRLTEMHRALYNDIADLYIGRLNRMGIERVFDNFWLLWPLSYTLKATKWLASIMFYRIGGVRTGAAGAYLYSEYRTRFLRALENDPELQEWMQENRDFMFLFEMFLPMSPESIGVSLNKSLRISGSWLNAMTIDSDEIREAVGDYSYVESVPETIEQTLRFGPLRTYNLFKRLMNQLEVPGWTYGGAFQSGGGLDNYTPTR